MSSGHSPDQLNFLREIQEPTQWVFEMLRTKVGRGSFLVQCFHPNLHLIVNLLILNSFTFKVWISGEKE